MTQIQATYYDGQSARDHAAIVALGPAALTIEVAGQAPDPWSLSGLHAIDPPAEGKPFRLSHADHPGKRLIIANADFIKQVMAAAPHLRQGYFSPRYLKQVAIWTGAGLAVFFGLLYGAMVILPHAVAGLLPEKMTHEIGKQVMRQLTVASKECETPDGRAALDVLAAKLSGQGHTEKVKIHVYDMPLLNAFAVPGGDIVLTREIIKEAETADEVAGVLAHEMGHVRLMHPEQQLVRLMGMQVVMSIFSGSNGGDVVTSAAGLIALFSYSREAEREADAFARDQLKAASIDPMGFKHFFEKIQKLESAKTKGDETSVLSSIGSILATHPGTADRIKLIEPLPAGVTAIPALTPEQWKAVQGMCG